jgi:hypothetical protein
MSTSISSTGGAVRDLFGAWRALPEAIKADGCAKTLDRGLELRTAPHRPTARRDRGTPIAPAINQVELHPWLPQLEVRDFTSRPWDPSTEAWSPLARGLDRRSRSRLPLRRSTAAVTRAVVIAGTFQLGERGDRNPVTASRIVRKFSTCSTSSCGCGGPRGRDRRTRIRRADQDGAGRTLVSRYGRGVITGEGPIAGGSPASTLPYSCHRDYSKPPGKSYSTTGCHQRSCTAALNSGRRVRSLRR